MLEELFMKLESMNVCHVFRVSKNKKMLVLNKNNRTLREGLVSDLF